MGWRTAYINIGIRRSQVAQNRYLTACPIHVRTYIYAPLATYFNFSSSRILLFPSSIHPSTLCTSSTTDGVRLHQMTVCQVRPSMIQSTGAIVEIANNTKYARGATIMSGNKSGWIRSARPMWTSSERRAKGVARGIGGSDSADGNSAWRRPVLDGCRR